MADSGEIVVDIADSLVDTDKTTRSQIEVGSGMTIIEVLRFAFFSAITVTVILTQLKISETYAIEQGISRDILSADSFDKISNATDVVEWIRDYFVPKVMELGFYPYDVDLYNSTQARIAWFNILTTNIRMVQKRMDLKENSSGRNNDQVDYAWDEIEYDIFESGASGEMTSEYGPTKLFTFNENIGVDSSGGYIQVINATVVESNLLIFKKAVDFLVNNNWIDRQTYALYIDFLTYNGHIGMLSYVRILIQLSASGSVAKKITTTSINVEPYNKAGDVFRGVLEVVLVILCLLYGAIEVYKIKLEVAAKKTEFMEEGLGLNTGAIRMVWEGIKSHFSYFWNWMDFASIVLSFVIIGLWIRYISSDLVTSGSSSSRPLEQMLAVKLIYEDYITACAINFLLVFVRMLKYLNRFERIALLQATFQSAKDDIFYFFVILITVMLTFVIFGHVAFGSTHYAFSSLGNSVLVCFVLLFGELTVWQEIRKTRPIEATFFFFMFTFLIVFIMINMFIAIINTHYSNNVDKLEANQKQNQDAIHPLVVIWHRIKALCHSFCQYFNKDIRIAKRYVGAEKNLTNVKDDLQMRFSEHNLNYLDSIKHKEFIDTEILTDKEILSKLAEITKVKKAEYRGALIFIVFALVYATTLIVQSQIGVKHMLVDTVRTAIENIQYSYQQDNYNVQRIFNYETFFLWSEQFPTLFETRISGDKFIGENYLVGHNLTYVPGAFDAGPIRMTLRRVELVDNPSKTFSEYQEKIRDTTLNAFSLTGDDDTSFTGGSSQYEYKAEGSRSFMDLGGFVMYLSSDFTEFNAQMGLMKSDLILNDTSCSIVLDFVLYNGNVNHVIYTAIAFNFDSGGSISSYLYIWPMELQLYTTPKQIARAFFEVVYLLLLGYHIFWTCFIVKQNSDAYGVWQKRLYEVLTDEQKNRRNEFQPEWLRKMVSIVDTYLFIDLLSYAFAISSIIAWITYLSSSRFGPELPEEDVEYFDNTDTLARGFKAYLDLSSVSLLLIFFSLLKYMAMNRSLSFLQSTIGAALIDLYFFLIMLITFMLGFAFMAYLAFGSHAKSFSEITKSLVTCFEMLVGSFDYQEMSEANENLAPFFFVLYLMLFVFVLLNIFVAILERAYSIVKQEDEDERESPVKFLEVLVEICVKRLLVPKDRRQYDHETQAQIMPEEVFVKMDTGLDGEMDSDSWALRFSEHILFEKSKRSQIRSRLFILYKQRKRREMEGRGFMINQAARRAEKKNRLQYWEYLRIGYQSNRTQMKSIIREARSLVDQSTRSYSDFESQQKEIEGLIEEIEKVERRLLKLNRIEEKELKQGIQKTE